MINDIQIPETASAPQTLNQEEDEANLAQFHIFKNHKATGPKDVVIRDYIKQNNRMFIIGKTPYFYSNGCYRSDDHGHLLKKKIEKCLYMEFRKAPVINRIHDLFIIDDDLNVTEQDLNKQPPYWINFRNGYFDPVENCMVLHDPMYFTTSQVAASYDPQEKPQGDEMEKWLRFAVEEPDDREMLLQYFGYCLTRDTRQQKFMIITGAGGTGKSTIIKLLERMAGEENTCHISMSEFSERFATIGLKDRLLNTCSELKSKDLQDTSRLKKIIGEDALRGEAKGKDAISFRSCAKLIFAANALPLIKEEKSNGFYRRLLILPMNHIPEKPREDLFEQLEKELPYFLHLCVDALVRMYHSGHITESSQSRKAVAQLRYESDSVEAFLVDETDRTYQGQVKRSDLYSEYVAYCMGAGLKYETRNGFFNALRTKGHSEKTINGTRLFCGVSLKSRRILPGFVDNPPAASSTLM